VAADRATAAHESGSRVATTARGVSTLAGDRTVNAGAVRATKRRPRARRKWRVPSSKFMVAQRAAAEDPFSATTAFADASGAPALDAFALTAAREAPLPESSPASSAGTAQGRAVALGAARLPPPPAWARTGRTSAVVAAAPTFARADDANAVADGTIRLPLSAQVDEQRRRCIAALGHPLVAVLRAAVEREAAPEGERARQERLEAVVRAEASGSPAGGGGAADRAFAAEAVAMVEQLLFMENIVKEQDAR
jgi:hypothetical protein